MNMPVVTPSLSEFQKFQSLIEEKAGIHLSPHKIHLLNGRLSKRLRQLNCRSYRQYFEMITANTGKYELQMAIDLITTNETYFFRELKHFDFLRDRVIPTCNEPLRIWSAACSTGEEPYSIAMQLSSHCRKSWEIFASDISTEALKKAKRAIYSDHRTDGIPNNYRKRYCLKGIDEYDGHIRIEPKLRAKVNFLNVNLMEALPEIGVFDVIFLRNVMIYFERDTQSRLIEKLTRFIKPGGYLFVGHSESLQGISANFRSIQPAIYQRR